MTLADLIRDYSLSAVKNRLLKYCPDAMYEYADVFAKLAVLQPQANSMRLVLEYVVDDDEELDYIEVSGRDGGMTENDSDGTDADVDPCRLLSIAFTPWEQWLGMIIDPGTMAAFEPLDVIVHCLAEMTVYGYDQDTIQTKMNELAGKT